MPDLVLHHYLGSPYAEKIRCILGFKNLAWRSVEISPVMPRPLLSPLTGGYRRSPVLQVGADVYCDTRRIAAYLEAIAPEPTLFPPGSRTLCDLVAGWVEPRVFLAAGPVRIRGQEDLGGFGAVSIEAFVADRAAFMRPALDVREAPALRPAAQDQLRCFLGLVAGLLSDGRPYLAGDALSLADFSTYHTVWWLRRPPAVRAALDEFPELEAWADRVSGIGHGRSAVLSPEAALEEARTANPELCATEDRHDPAGRKPGDRVRIQADDYGRDEVDGAVVALSREHVSILRSEPGLGDVVVHFPRIGFRVLPAAPSAGTTQERADRTAGFPPG